MPSRRVFAATVMTVAVAAAGCQSTPEPIIGQPVADGTVMYSDDDVAGVLNTVNTSEIETSELAVAKAKHPSVREFAQRLITDHGDANEMLADVSAEDNINLNRPPIATDLEAGTSQTLRNLQKFEGAEFDRRFMDFQIAQHEWAIETLDNVLLPSARESDLENHIMDYRATLMQHLEEARQIRASLGR